jgi:hypothetical protein
MQSVKWGRAMKFNEQEIAMIEAGKAKLVPPFTLQNLKLVTIKELAARLDVTVRTVRKLHASEDGPHRVPRKGQYLYLPEVADAIFSAWKRGER